MNPTFNAFAGQPLPHSRGTLVTVAIAHVAAALLAVQLFEARRYVEPMPLLVSLLPAPQQVAVEPSRPSQPPPEIIREVRVEPEPIPEPPRPVKLEPEPAPLPKPVPVQKMPEPAPEKIVEPTPMPPAPEPPPRAITEVPVPPPTPEPVLASVPEPLPVVLPPPPPTAVAEPLPQEAIAPVPVQAAQPPDEVSMPPEMLTAVYLRNPKPGYPNLSRRLREQGTVLLRVFVTMAGDPTKVELKSSSGFPRLDRAAHDAVQRWKFVPAKRGDQPVDAWVIVPIRFTLKG